MEVKFNELETNIKDKNFRDSYMDINGFKNLYQPTTDIVKNDKGDQVLDIHSIWVSGGIIFLNYWKYVVSMSSETEKHTAEPLAPEPSTTEV